HVIHGTCPGLPYTIIVFGHEAFFPRGRPAKVRLLGGLRRPEIRASYVHISFDSYRRHAAPTRAIAAIVIQIDAWDVSNRTRYRDVRSTRNHEHAVEIIVDTIGRPLESIEVKICSKVGYVQIRIVPGTLRNKFSA